MRHPIYESAARAEWREGWVLPLVSMAAMAVTVSHLYTIGVFMPALETEFGWSRTQIAGGLTILSTISVILSPFMGAAIDRFGSRRIGLPGIALYCAAIAGLAAAGPSIASWWALWIIVAFGSLCIKPTVWTAAIATRFDSARGIAIAVALCGTGIGSALLPWIATTLLGQFGWRGAYVAIGAGGATLALPLIWLFFRDGRTGEPRRTKVDREHLAGLALRPALRSALFVKLCIASLLVTTGLTALLVHFVPILIGHGLSPRAAAATTGLVGLATIVGRLASGVLLDRYSGPRIGLISFGLPVLVCALLFFDIGQPLAIVAALLLGLAMGSEIDVMAYLASRYFGLRHFGALFGTMIGLQSFGAGLGPLLSGNMFDRFGGYDELVLIVAPLFVISALLIGSLGRYPDFADEGRI